MSAPILPMLRKRDAIDVIGEQVADFLREMKVRVERETRIECATEAVEVAADWAAKNSMTCHPDAAAVCEDLGEAVRKKIMEGAE